MSEQRLAQATRPLRGDAQVPADKSLSHRAAILAALAEGETTIDNYLESATTQATLSCLRGLGVAIEQPAPGRLLVRGCGLRALSEPAGALYCLGSGTTLRLLAGLCAGQPFLSILTGTPRLQSRPMARVVEPLRAMGTTVLGREGGRLAPLAVQGGGLRGLEWTSGVASAQVKSAVLLAGLFAEGPTSVREPGPSRDHTERLLRGLGVDVTSGADAAGAWARLVPPARLPAPGQMAVPGDFSSAAFLLVAALLLPRSELVLRGVGVNPTRTGLLNALRAMGAAVQTGQERLEWGEPVADLAVQAPAGLRATSLGGELVPRMIDEFPILAVAATQAHGQTVVQGAAELRVKESDRIATLAQELGRLGAVCEERPDGFAITGPTPLRGARVQAHGDHRLAMSLAVAALIAEGETVIEGWECVADSYPDFAQTLASLVGG
ncbi:MAG: 3-phosphoshikimate 1-carboxyvinyltransferase [Chloroflexota bacterium]